MNPHRISVTAAKPRKTAVLTALASLALAGLACSVLFGPDETTPESPSLPVDPTQTATLAGDVPPGLATEAVSGVEIECGGVSLILPPSLAAGAICESITAVPESDSVAPWDVGPEHVRLTLEGYLLPETFHLPRIYVYPAAEFTAMNETAGGVIDRLRSFLVSPPATFERGIPFLPPFNAAQMLRAQVRFVDFQEGSGVRFLTLYGQAYRIVNNHELFYTFQGLTHDDAYYVAAILPVSHPNLPAQGDIPPDEFEAFAEDFDGHIAASEAALNGYPDESFMPDLSLLDALLGGLQIE
ncbi:MAG TPA: hypothetical protein VGA52_06390 [Anaerolineales bacterium]|jgi:hypothetical protein